MNRDILVDSRPIGFYLDTLTKDLFYNTYNVDESNPGYKNEKDFSRYCDVGKINYKEPPYQVIRDRGLYNLFQHKLNVNSVSGNILLDISNDNIEELAKGNRTAEPISISLLTDLNNDNQNEKITFILKYGNDGEGNPDSLILLNELQIVFSSYKNKQWVVYDELILKKELESRLDRILIFKPGLKFSPVIYINSASDMPGGKIMQSQLLLWGGRGTKA
jgi:hypothetical protein